MRPTQAWVDYSNGSTLSPSPSSSSSRPHKHLCKLKETAEQNWGGPRQNKNEKETKWESREKKRRKGEKKKANSLDGCTSTNKPCTGAEYKNKLLV